MIDQDVGLDTEGVKTAVLETQRANGMTSDAHAWLMVTRGVKTRPFPPQPSKPDRAGHSAAYPRSAMTQDPELNSHSKLNGITRQKVIDLYRSTEIPLHKRNYSLVDAYGLAESCSVVYKLTWPMGGHKNDGVWAAH